MTVKNTVRIIYPDEYSLIFNFETDANIEVNDILEMIFAQWNHGSGLESELFIRSKKRSLSVGDIVCVNNRYFQCASFGWNEVTSEYVTQLEKEVATHPRRHDGAWFALSEVMWQYKQTIDVKLVA
jgi:hypothetical protein